MIADDERRERARARRENMTLRLVGPHDARPDPFELDGEEAVSLVAELTRRAWALSGRPWPSHRRDEMPIRLVPRT